MDTVRGQADARCGRGHRLGGRARVRRRDGQRPHPGQARPGDPAQLRRGPAVRVRGRLAAGRLRGAGRGLGRRVGRGRRAVRVPAGIAVLPGAGRPAGRRGQEPRGPQGLRGRRRAARRTRRRQTVGAERQVRVYGPTRCDVRRSKIS